MLISLHLLLITLSTNTVLVKFCEETPLKHVTTAKESAISNPLRTHRKQSKTAYSFLRSKAYFLATSCIRLQL